MRIRPICSFLICAAIGLVLVGNDTAQTTIRQQSDLASPAYLPGQVIVDPGHPQWLKRQGGGHLFMCGPGDPEGFLYRGQRNTDGARDGDQMAVINKLARHGGNALYLIAVRTPGGDAWKDKRDNPAVYPDDLHNPWLDQDPKKGLNEAILRQWETWFAEMDRQQIIIYFFFYDDAIDVAKRFGWALDTRGELHPEEKRFVQSIVNRFEHHKNLIWCVMEEAQEIGAHWQRHISKIAAAIREADDHDHAIASHQLAGNTFFHAGDPNIDQFAIQTHDLSVRTRPAFHDWLVEAWRNAAGRYNLNMSEDPLHRELCQNGDRAGLRQRNWAAAMAGAYVMVLGMDGAETPIEWLEDCRRLQQFFESTDFYRMQPADELKREETEFVLAAPGRSCIAYSAASKTSLGLKDLPASDYDLRWYDCATGQSVERTNVRLRAGEQHWPKPQGFSSEVALYLRRRGSETDLPLAKTTTDGKAVASAKPNRPPAVKNKSYRTKANTPFDLQLTYVDPDGGPGPYTTTVITQPRFGALSGAGNDLTYTPRRGYSGADRFTWKVN
ncbi:MAG: Ig-like domain-containing protein, partial [Blastocatellia bacterium]